VTIRKGQAWGSPLTIPTGLVQVASNAELAAAVINGPPNAPIIISGGDLGRTLGLGSRTPSAGTPGTALPLDLIRVELNGRTGWMGLHLIVRNSWWRGAITAAMNVQFLGDWDVAPRAHPNDGKFDRLQVAPDMTVGDRWKARSRLALGTHLPHPKIQIRQMTSTEIELDHRAAVHLDGVRWATGPGTLSLSIVPDAYTAVIAAGTA
jgi:YegS C-terminal NAD kinase beta sandwich-like domain